MYIYMHLFFFFFLLLLLLLPCQDIFEELAREDPHRLQGMDTFSNILYVNEAFSELSALAHRAMATDKYRAETCCIIGNYYSLRGQHEKSVIYFKRWVQAG